jgi:hypothetical protein
MIGEYKRKLTDKVNYQLLLVVQGLWTLSTILYWKKNIVFWELPSVKGGGGEGG